MNSQSVDFCYRIDVNNLLVDIGPGWDEFALANGGPQACRAAVMHKPLLDFLDGAEVKQLTATLLAHARSTSKTLALPFRCDGPEHKRYLLMTLRGEPNGDVEIRTRIMHEEPHPRFEILDTDAQRNEDLIRICAWCNRILLNQDWAEIDEAVSRMGLFCGDAVPQLNHGICPDCTAAANEEMDRMR